MRKHSIRGRRSALLGGLVSIALVAAACGGDDDADDVSPPPPDAAEEPDDTAAPDEQDDVPDPTPPSELDGRLVIAFESDPTVIDPYFATNYTARSISQALFDTLVMNWNGELVPTLAESFEALDDQTLQFVLRDGITFHNGEVFDAEAVRYNVERMLSPETDSHHLPRFEKIDSVEIIDERTVNINLSEPDAQILDAFTHMFIVPPEYDQEVGLEGFAQAPVGTGPFTFVSYTPEDSAVFAANEGYWEGSPKGRPMTGELIFRFIPEVTTKVAELTTGGVDLAYPLGSDQVATVETAGGQIVSYNDYSIRFIQVNASSAGTIAEEATGAAADGFAALEDSRVRTALNLAIDREAITEALFGGRAQPLGQPYAEGSFAYPSDPPLYPYDPDRARDLLEEAGYGDGLQLELLANVTHEADELALVQSYFADIGVTLELSRLESGVYNEGWIGGQWPHLRFSSWGTPETVLGLLFESGGLLSSYSNSELDALIAEQRVTLDPAARFEILDQIPQILHDDAASVFLWSIEAIVGMGPDVRGWEPQANFVPATNTYVER